MANIVTIEAEARARAGKGAARATRRAGRVPAVIYGAHIEPSLISLDPRAILREVHRGGWQSRLYEVKVDGQSTRALIRAVAYHPVTDAPQHVDFQRLAAGEKIRVSVPVHFEGELASPGLKRGGVLNVVRHTVEVMADPDNIPERFEADMSTLDIGDNIRFHDLKGAEGSHPVTAEADAVIATLAPPTKMAEAEAAPAAAAPAAKAPAKKG
jgi:large subunit ribosomal protein L25